MSGTRILELGVYGALLLLAAGAGCSRKPAAKPEGSAAPTVTTQTPPAATAAAKAEPGAAALCSARTRSSVHLRPTEKEKSAGPELPAGSELAVLGRGHLMRKGLAIYHVRAKASQLAGYVYLGESELGADCPLIWPDPSLQKKSEPIDTKLDDGMGSCFRAGTFKDRKGMFDPRCVADHGKPPAADHKLDVDGDGRPDELIDYADELVLALHTARGYTPLLLARGIDTEHHDGAAAWLEPVRAGDALYLATAYHETSSFDTEEDSTEYVSSHTLYRVQPDGQVLAVLTDSVGQSDVRREFHGNPDGSVVISDGGSRKQTLRWDPRLLRFVP